MLQLGPFPPKCTAWSVNQLCSKTAWAATSVMRVGTAAFVQTGFPKYTMVRIIGGIVTRCSGTIRAKRAT